MTSVKQRPFCLNLGVLIGRKYNVIICDNQVWKHLIWLARGRNKDRQQDSQSLVVNSGTIVKYLQACVQ